MKKQVMELVLAISNLQNNDCRGLCVSKEDIQADLINQLFTLAKIPASAQVCELPISDPTANVILFTVENDKNYYELFSGVGKNGNFYFTLSLCGTQDGNLVKFNNENIEIPIDYFVGYEELEKNSYAEFKLLNKDMDIYCRHMFDLIDKKEVDKYPSLFLDWYNNWNKCRRLILQNGYNDCGHKLSNEIIKAYEKIVTDNKADLYLTF